MVTYETLLIEADQKGLKVFERPMPPRLKGAYGDLVICINSLLETQAAKASAMSEETGHFETSFGDILDQSILMNRKQEKRARTWGYFRMISLGDFITAHAVGVRNRYEFAQILGVTEEFLEDALTRFQQIYGLHTTHEGHIIMFEPLMVIEPIEL